MSFDAHIKTLTNRHKQLDQEINYAFTHHMSEQKMAELKKKKLMLKDEIQQLMARKHKHKHAA